MDFYVANDVGKAMAGRQDVVVSLKKFPGLSLHEPHQEFEAQEGPG